ncbi:MAG: hypothetical protein M3Y87_23695 [Myxococcota bacterium]|nr:hypothetical protein [Myxococcota bacterium]
MLTALLLALGGCDCAEIEGYYAVVAGHIPDHPGTIDWDVIANPGSGRNDDDHVRVQLPLGSLPPALEMIEFFEDGRPLGIAGTFRSRHEYQEEGTGCIRMDAVDYDLSVLPAGAYVMVHRLSRAPAGLPLQGGAEAPVTRFEDEDALVTTLILYDD